ncbi:uncharacterized protein LOC135818912 [Sycon ciliatum]|uniref:uncharacterized protein LOC135818912 n=1 Tax=Sycon ciliatum TaxID=27933 RepID=UPI0031F6775B
MRRLLVVLLLDCCTSLAVAEFGASNLKGLVTIRSDSDSASFSADQSEDSDDSVDNEVQMPMEPCFLTQTCQLSGNAFRDGQPIEFELIQMAFNALPETNLLLNSANTILDQQDAVLNTGVLASDVDCFMSQDMQSPFAALAKKSLGFSVVRRSGSLFTYTYTNLPSSFGTLRVIIGFPPRIGGDQPILIEFLSVQGEFRRFSLHHIGQVCTLDEPLVCGGAEPTDLPFGPPRLPPAQARDLNAVTTAIQNGLCPTT